MENQGKKKRGFSFANKFRKLDIFGESVAFQIAGAGSVTSCAEAMMTLLITIVTIAYA